MSNIFDIHRVELQAPKHTLEWTEDIAVATVLRSRAGPARSRFEHIFAPFGIEIEAGRGLLSTISNFVFAVDIEDPRYRLLSLSRVRACPPGFSIDVHGKISCGVSAFTYRLRFISQVH